MFLTAVPEQMSYREAEGTIFCMVELGWTCSPDLGEMIFSMVGLTMMSYKAALETTRFGAAVAMIASLGRRATTHSSVMKAMTNFREMSETIRFSVAKVRDALFGQDGNDIHGEAGDDLLNGGRGNDELDGGDGIDDVQDEREMISRRWRRK